MADFISNEQIVQAARKNLSQASWDYLVGASESETTMRRNRLGVDCIAFKPRVLVRHQQMHTRYFFMLRDPDPYFNRNRDKLPEWSFHHHRVR